MVQRNTALAHQGPCRGLPSYSYIAAYEGTPEWPLAWVLGT